MEWVAAAPLSWWGDEDGGRVVEVRGIPVAVFRHRGRWHAMSDRCPHLRIGLSGGEIVGDAVRCPGHGWLFSLEDGRVRKGMAGLAVPIYGVRIRDAMVEIRIAPSGNGATQSDEGPFKASDGIPICFG